MKKVGIVMGSDSDMPVMSKAAAILDKLGVEYEMKIISAHREPDVFFEYAKSAEEKRIKGDHCRRRNGSSSAGNVRGDLSHAGDRNSDAHHVSGRKRFSLFYRSDAFRNPGGYRCHQWRRKRGTSGGKNPCDFRSGASCQTEGLQQRTERTGRSKGCQTAGSRLSELLKRRSAEIKKENSGGYYGL